MFDVLVAGVLGLARDRNRVDVRGVSGERQMFAVHACEFDLFFDQVVGTVRAYCRNHAIQRFQPFAGFLGIVVFIGGDIFHDFVGYSGHARLLGMGNAL
ncbi:hypothetical protein OKW27_004469 [Paraburkholderia sp. 35.1]